MKTPIMHYQTATIRLPTLKETATPYNPVYIRSSNDIIPIVSDIANLAQESMTVLSLNLRNRLLNRHLVSLGILDSALLHAREVFRAAIIDNAKGIVLVHNHPSGDTTPSTDDVQITRSMIEAGKIIGISVLDHIVVSYTDKINVLSIRESGLLAF